MEAKNNKNKFQYKSCQIISTRRHIFKRNKIYIGDSNYPYHESSSYRRRDDGQSSSI